METKKMEIKTLQIGAAEIVAISAAVTTFVQFLKWAGLGGRFAPIACLLTAALAVSLYALSTGVAFSTTQLWTYFTATGAVALSAAGIFGFTKAAGEGIANAAGPPDSE
jgi:hypothetical protein